LENLGAEVDIHRASETIRENIKISAKGSLVYYELKKHMPWLDEGFSKLLDQRKQTKLQRLQIPSEISGNNLNYVIREASRRFRNKKREYMRDKVKDLATNRNNKKIRVLYGRINEFKWVPNLEVTS
jgi:hypothetical protein